MLTSGAAAQSVPAITAHFSASAELSQPPVPPRIGASLAELPSERSRGRLILLIVALYAGAILLPFLGSNRILTKHEVIVAQPALNMLNGGSWIAPKYNTNEPWVEKPPLVSWLDAALFSVTGFSEWSARLPAALCGIGLAVLVAAVALRFEPRDERGAPRPLWASAALYAGLAQASCVYVYMQGRLGEIDIVFALLIAGAHAALLWRWGSGATDLPLANAALFHTLAGIAVLAKGPLAVAFFGCSILGFCAARRSIRPLLAVLFTPAIVCFFAAAGWWYVAVYRELGDFALQRWHWTYVNRIMGEHVQGRQSALVYIASIPWQMLPWAITLVIGIPQLRRTISNPNAHFERYLWCWFYFGLVPLLVSAFKHKHYAIPLLPPLSILAGQLIATHVLTWGPAWKKLYAALFAGILVAYLVVGGVVMSRHDPRRETTDFIRDISRQVPAGEKLVLIGLAQSGVFPYLTCDWVGTNKLQEVQDILSKADGRPVWVLTQRQYLYLPQARDLQFDELAAEKASKKPLRVATLCHVFGRITGGTLHITDDAEDLDASDD